MARKRSAEDIKSELIGPLQLAAMLGCRREQVYTLAARGAVPKSVRLEGGNQRWRRREVLDWIDSGMPHVDSWHWLPTIRRDLQQWVEHLKGEARSLSDEITARKAELGALERTT